MNDFPSSLDVYDIGQFHNLQRDKHGVTLFIAEHELMSASNPPSHVVIHQKEEFYVLKQHIEYPMSYSDAYLNPKHNLLRFEFTMLYTPKNTKIDVYPFTIVLKATDAPKDLDSIASYSPTALAPVHYAFENLSKGYAQALVEHHLMVAPDEPRNHHYQNCAPLEWSTG